MDYGRWSMVHGQSSDRWQTSEVFEASEVLRFGAYDLIVTPQGGTVFLEVNPTGQWLRLERRLHLEISRALMDDG